MGIFTIHFENKWQIFLQIFFLHSVSCQNLEIMIAPNQIQIGNDLNVICQITENSIDKSFGVFLKCPFNNQIDFCIKDCFSLDSCTNAKCNSKAVEKQNFTCDFSSTVNSITFSYRFISLSESSLKYSKQVSFGCFFRGKTSSKIVNVSKDNSVPSILASSPGITRPPPKQFSTNTASIIETVFKERDIILISLIAALLLSILVNIWCSVQWCIKTSKKKNLKRNRTPNELQRSYPMTDLNSNHYSNSMSSQYDPPENIKRTRSQPTLPHDDRITLIKSNSNTSYNTGSISSRPKYSRPNTMTFENNNDICSGSRNSLSTPIYGHVVYAPVQYVDPSMLIYGPQYSTSYFPHSAAVENKSLNYLDIVNEQDCPERQNSSVFQPLPRKPDEILSDKESVFA